MTDSDINEPFIHKEGGGTDWLSRFHSANSFAIWGGNIRFGGELYIYVFTVHTEKSIWEHEMELICDAVAQDIEIC